MSPRADRPGAAPPIERLAALRRRADLLARTRQFFAARGVLEVETPLLGRGLVVDTHIDPISCDVGPTGRAQPHYLLPSPEAPMKRLLAAGSGPIFQIAKAFRQGEQGRLHRPEFTMLEWYRPGLTYHALIDEVGELLRDLLGIETWTKRSVRDVYVQYVGLDPHTATANELATTARERGVAFAASDARPAASRTEWLDLLFATCIGPALDPDTPTFVFDFPADQAALSTLDDGDPPRAQRFELLYRGMELCNGYEELRDADEHRRRFAASNAERIALGKAALTPDDDLIAAVQRGLPACSGVAVGFDRVVMIACGALSIDQVTG